MNSYFDKGIKNEKLAGFLLCFVVALFAIYNPYEKTIASILLSIGIIFVATIPYFVWRKRKDHNLVILGLFYYGLFHMICYGIAGFISHQIPAAELMQDLSEASEIKAKQLIIAHLLIVFGTVYFLQFLFKTSKATKIPTPKVSITAYRFSMALCFFLAFVEFLRAAGIPPFSMMAEGIAFLLVSFFAYMYLFYFLFYLGFGRWFTKILAVFGFLIINGVLTGGVGILAFVVVAIIMVLISIQKGQMPVMPILLLVLGYLIFQPMKGTVRGMAVYSGYGPVESIMAGFQEVEGSEYLALIDLASTRIDQNNFMTSLVEHIGVRDNNDHTGWKNYKNVLYGFIPRVFWPKKPSDEYGNTWAVQEGYLQRTDRVTSYGFPWVPQMYLSFGVQGVIFGSFFIAIFLFLIDRYYWTIQLNPWSFAIGYSIMRPLIKLGSDFGMVFGMVTKIIMIDLAVRMIRQALIQKRIDG